MTPLTPTPQTALDICNLALSKLGEAPLSSLDRNAGTAARLCYLHYHPTRREVLVAHRWTFAQQYATLTSAESAPGDTAPRQQLPHSLPSDCLRVLQVSSPSWVLRGRCVYCPQASVHILYIADIEDPALFEPLFIDAFCTLLACKLCIPLTASTTARQMLTDEYHRLILPKAAHFNAVQSASNDSHPLRQLLRHSASPLHYSKNCE